VCSKKFLNWFLYLKTVQVCKSFTHICPENDTMFTRKRNFQMIATIALWGIYKIISLLPQNEQWLNPWWDQLNKFIGFRDCLLRNNWFIPSHTRVRPEGTTILLNSNLAVENPSPCYGHILFYIKIDLQFQILQYAMTNANVKNHFIMPWWMFWNLTGTLLLLMMFTLVLLFLIWFQSWGVTIVSLPFQWRILFNYAYYVDCMWIW